MCLCVNEGVDVRLVRKGGHILEYTWIEFVDMLIYFLFLHVFNRKSFAYLYRITSHVLAV